MQKVLEKKIPVGILGATGRVGQKLVKLLSFHPWFTPTFFTASPKNVGKSVVDLFENQDLPKEVLNQSLVSCTDPCPCSLLFSALPADVAKREEWRLAEEGHMVISNARAYRMHASVPILIPEINPEHLSLLDEQPFAKGKIATNPNCCVAPLVLALAPLQERWGIRAVDVTTMQAISGAGFFHESQMDIKDNILPHIPEEEEKIEIEPLKILAIKPEDVTIQASCYRVPVSDGHTLSVRLQLEKDPSKEELIDGWNQFKGKVADLPSSPKQLIYYCSDPLYPQPKVHKGIEKGMAIAIGGCKKRGVGLF